VHVNKATVFREGAVYEAMGNRMTVRLTAEATGGVCGSIDFEVAPGFRAPPVPHHHQHEDWWGQVLDGELAIELDGVVHALDAGATVFVPRGVNFRWWNPTPRPARWLLVWSPGGFERYFGDVGEALAGRAPTPEVLAAVVPPLWARYGLRVAGEGA